MFDLMNVTKDSPGAYLANRGEVDTDDQYEEASDKEYENIR